MNIERVCLEARKSIKDCDRPFPNQWQIGERLSNPQIRSVIAADLHSQEGTELLILFYEGAFKIGAQGMVSLIETLKNYLEFSIETFGDSVSEHVRYLVRC